MRQGGDDEAIVAELLDSVLADAVAGGASDIHFEPGVADYRIRLRIDGLLRRWRTLPPGLHLRIAARLKVMARLDIAERQVPQDGRIQHDHGGRTLDIRVSTLPTVAGEKIVLRLFATGSERLGLAQLGCEEEQIALLRQAIARPQGMVLVTGPTGSGKTVTLYAALDALNEDTRNIATVEDPVEIRLPGINQVQHNPRRGMTFAAALRAFLRQDPDILMVGEIRDAETAEIAVKAAQTGHLVLSTLHTNDAAHTITRLLHMGIAPYHLTGSVTLVIAQRLLRCLCPACRCACVLPAAAARAAGFGADSGDVAVFEATGCTACHDGYRGRSGIYQMLPMSAQLADLIHAGAGALELAAAAARAGVRSLRDSALVKVRRGMTSLAEADRVTL